jgi:predicted thioesterase
MTVPAGLRGVVEAVVGPADTARALGSGDVDVLGTPRVLALVEAATVAAVAGALRPGQTTVGSRVELDHLAPTRPGTAVRAEALLVAVTGRRLTFEVTLAEAGAPAGTDPAGRLVARGTVLRAVVDRNGFPG